MHFEHQTIENTALPATWLRQVNPQPKTDGSTPILIVKTHYSVYFSHHHNAEKYRQFSKFGCVFAPTAKYCKLPNPTDNVRTEHFNEFKRGNIVHL